MKSGSKWIMVLGCLGGALVVACGSGNADDASAGESDQAVTSSAMTGPSGNFTSRVCEPVGVGGDSTYQIRHYRFDLHGATSTWDRFSDPQCSDDSKLMSIVMTGSAKLTGLSKEVTLAANITVSIATKTITPTAAGLAIVQAACGKYTWQADTAQEIDGCGSLLQQTDDCAAEYDLMKLTSAGLVFGDRSHPLCSDDTRPTELSQWSVVLDPFGYVGPAVSNTNPNPDDTTADGGS